MNDRFPPNELFSLLDRNPTYQLGESTTPNLKLSDLLDEHALARLMSLDIAYGTPTGNADLRDAIGKILGVGAEEVMITVGGAAALFLINLVLLGKGDEAVIPTPNFPPTADAMAALDASVTRVPLRFDNGYRYDDDAFRAALGPGTKLVHIVSPQNPSGVAFATAEVATLLAAMDEICPEAYLVVDEAYREAVYGNARPQPSAAAIGDRVLTLSSFSKCHGAPGIRTGWLTCRDSELYERLRIAKMNIFVSHSVVDEALALEVMARRDRILSDRRRHLGTGVARVADWAVANAELIEWLRPDGGALSCARLRAERFGGDGIERFHDAVAAHDAMVSRGEWFGDEPSVFRLGFGHLPLDTLDAALERLSAALRESADSAPPRSRTG